MRDRLADARHEQNSHPSVLLRPVAENGALCGLELVLTLMRHFPLWTLGSGLSARQEL